MIVVADSSPINYLVLMGHIAVLEALFSEVVVPRGVASELRSPGAPERVRKWMRGPPPWFHEQTVSDVEVERIDSRLHRGEREAIALAERLRADYVIIDEKVGRRVALDRSLTVVGTLGVLEKADASGLVADFPGALRRLRSTSFYLGNQLEETLLRRHRERHPR